MRRSHAHLTPRQREIVLLIASGLSNAEVALRLNLSAQTIKNHMHELFLRLDVYDRVGIVIYAYEHGLVIPGRGAATTSGCAERS